MQFCVFLNFTSGGCPRRLIRATLSNKDRAQKYALGLKEYYRSKGEIVYDSETQIFEVYV